MRNNTEEKGADLREIQRAVAVLHEPGQVVEIRAPGELGTISGYYDDHVKLASAVKRLSDRGDFEGVYFTLNPCHEALLARREKNTLHRGVRQTTTDAEIVGRRWLLIDFDPKRPKGVSATSEEKVAAKELMFRVEKALRKARWPLPVIMVSGNGYHMLYRVDEPNDAETADLFKKSLVAIAAQFPSKAVDIDTKVYNAARITKAYGSMAAKGADTKERPHRLSKILFVPKSVCVVARSQLEKLASTNATTKKPSNRSHQETSTISPDEIGKFLAWGNVEVRSVTDTAEGGRKWILAACPFNDEHTNSPAVFLSSDGVLGFKCFHASCGDKHWKEFRQAVEEKKGEKFNFTPRNGSVPYESTPAGILWHKNTPNGEKSDVLLTNFPARFTADITEDDGISSQHFYKIEARINGRTRCVTASAGDLTSTNWPLEKLGGRAVLLQPGATNRDRVRVALQLISTDMEERTVFTHTGWRQVDHEWLYLHAGGAISAQGFRDDISVSLPTDLEKFLLPAPPTGAQRLAAVRASLRFLDIAPRRITVPAYAGIWRAVWGNPGFSQFFAGPTGTYKSSCASLCQAHFGAAFDWEHLPGSWRYTANATAELQFKLKDTLFTVDDFVPKGSLSDVQRAHLDADKVLRGAANNAARGRLGRDSLLKESKPPRCFTLSTGEEIPRGQSLQARLWVTDFAEGDVDFKRLKLCADDASRGLFSATMSAYLQWVATRRNSIEKDLRGCVKLYRDAADRQGQHAKTPQMVAELAAGLKYFLLFTKECGALTPAEANSLFKECWRALIEGGKIQTRGLAEEDPAQRFVSLICSALVNARDAHLGKAESGAAEDGAKGRCIGWFSGDKVFLDPDNAYAVANELAKAQGEALPVDTRTLWKRLRQSGFLSCWDKDGHNTVVRKIGLRRQRVLSVWKHHIIQLAPEAVDSSSAEDSSL